MARLAVALSKSSLLRLQGDLEFLRAGSELLEQKREFLSEALRTFAREARAGRERVEERLADAYEAVAEAHAALGERGLDALALAADPIGAVEVRERSLMGVIVPVAQLAGAAGEGKSESSTGAPDRAALRSGPGGPGLAAGVASARLRALLPELAALAELETSCSKLARELARTRRKQNALEQVHIPAHVETIRFLAEQLEEREREALFQLKRVTALREGTS
ncbi:MAG TPA: V-type ATP synthase subunit D [Myxococcota bacterium]|nr:V-type ATP synthase subunit D [Myxococcota bacterium]